MLSLRFNCFLGKIYRTFNEDNEDSGALCEHNIVYTYPLCMRIFISFYNSISTFGSWFSCRFVIRVVTYRSIISFWNVSAYYGDPNGCKSMWILCTSLFCVQRIILYIFIGFGVKDDALNGTWFEFELRTLQRRPGNGEVYWEKLQNLVIVAFGGDWNQCRNRNLLNH